LTGYRRVGRIVPAEFARNPVAPDPTHFVEQEERALYAAYQAVQKPANTERDALTALARLRPAVDAFFNKVLVMAEEPTVRNNRLALVYAVKSTYDQMADFSKILTTAPSAQPAAPSGRR